MSTPQKGCEGRIYLYPKTLVGSFIIMPYAWLLAEYILKSLLPKENASVGNVNEFAFVQPHPCFPTTSDIDRRRLGEIESGQRKGEKKQDNARP